MTVSTRTLGRSVLVVLGLALTPLLGPPQLTAPATAAVRTPEPAAGQVPCQTQLTIGRLVASRKLGGCPSVQAERTPQTSVGPAVAVTLTTHSGSQSLSAMPALHFSALAGSLPTLHVDDRPRRQTVTGFGGAMTDTSAWLLHDELAPSARAKAMDELFSRRSGIGLSLIRVPIGASDFSATGVPYSYDDLSAGQSDPTLANFSIAHDEAYILPALHQMLSVDPLIKVLATTWSPPAWMKADDRFGNLGGAGGLNAVDYEPLAQYFVKFIRSYGAAGVPIWAITPENEPDSTAPYPSMELSALDEGRLISANLAPALASAGLHTRLFGGDQVSNLAYGQQLMGTPAASELSGMAWHCYGGIGVVGQFHLLYPKLPELMSECSPGIVPYASAEIAIDALRNSAAGVDLWNLALDPSGGPVQAPDSGCRNCSGLLTVDERTHTVKPRLNYYQLGQLSKFIEPGAVVLGGERWVSDFSVPGRYGVRGAVDDVAAINPDGAHVLVAYNNSPSTARFSVAYQARQFSYRLGGRATVTFTWR